ncbi:UDP-glucuronosyltransferase 2A2-like [Genypterus blacodes]|uniref:UDP-glucuronosyltransferase 2A2-like n=1 Tax=Genypterus blacodes TaxID=154954 RepID=UPI003F76EFFB
MRAQTTRRLEEEILLHVCIRRYSSTMKLGSFCSSLLLLLIIPKACQGENILVFPSEGSHWVNMDILIQALHAKGHNITIVRSSKSWYIKDNSHYNTIMVQMEKGLIQDQLKKMLDPIIENERGSPTLMRFFHMALGMFHNFIEATTDFAELTKALLDDKELMQNIKDGKFDAMIADPSWGSGTILAKYLNLPLIYYVRWLLLEEAHLAIAPSPLSYIPVTGSHSTDKMTFAERVKNVFLYVATRIQSTLIIKQTYQKICDEYLEPGTDFYQLMQAADLWLMRVDFVFEFPRPTMPNVIYMGGFQCKPAKPLPQHLEDFIQSSGEHGVIIMSLGTLIGELPQDLADEIAAAFASLPQKVIWRYKGARPATLGNNTLLVDWIPQSDLLGHPKIKVFVAHGGTHGVQEAMYHGVPILGLPVFFDQHDNLLRLTERGAAKMLTLDVLDKDTFLKAIQEVLHEPLYRTNMQRLSRLHRDQPMHPLDLAIFWIEFVMRHKGAAHLRTESYKMPWYSYHSVDVMLFLLGVVLLVCFTVFILMRCLCIAICKRKVKRE